MVLSSESCALTRNADSSPLRMSDTLGFISTRSRSKELRVNRRSQFSRTACEIILFGGCPPELSGQHLQVLVSCQNMIFEISTRSSKSPFVRPIGQIGPPPAALQPRPADARWRTCQAPHARGRSGFDLDYGRSCALDSIDTYPPGCELGRTCGPAH